MTWKHLFEEVLKDLLTVNKAFKVRELSAYQKQAVIKLVEKKKTKKKNLLKTGDQFVFSTLTKIRFHKFERSV